MPEITFGLYWESEFSYTCNRCNRCCHDKYIPLSPYDLIRLAYGLGITTGELIERHTTEGVRLLRREDEPGTPCVFLGDQGCTVHAHRPAVCRVYPLGQSTMPSGHSFFGHLPPHPKTEGIYGRSGTIGAYLEAQGYGPYETATTAYGQLYDEVAAALSKTDVDEIETEPSGDAPHLLDVDAWVSDYCSKEGIGFPSDPEEKYRLHITAVMAWLNSFQ